MEPVADSKPWIKDGPEARLSIAVKRLLSRCLLPPCYFSTCGDADGVARTENARAREANRGRRPGLLDWDVVQGCPTLARKLELKRGKGVLSENQKATIAALTKCGAPPLVAWDLRQVYRELAAAGFRFSNNVHHVVAHLEAELAGWDREADLIKSGAIVRKPARKPKPQPRFVMGKRAVTRARRSGIMI